MSADIANRLRVAAKLNLLEPEEYLVRLLNQAADDLERVTDELDGYKEKAQLLADMWAASEARLKTAYQDCREMATALHSIAPNGSELLNLSGALDLATEQVLVWRTRALAAEAGKPLPAPDPHVCEACGSRFVGSDDGWKRMKAQHVCSEGDL